MLFLEDRVILHYTEKNLSHVSGVDFRKVGWDVTAEVIHPGIP